MKKSDIRKIVKEEVDGSFNPGVRQEFSSFDSALRELETLKQKFAGNPMVAQKINGVLKTLRNIQYEFASYG